MLIDFHTHCFPDHLAPKALQNLQQVVHRAPCTDGTSKDLLEKCGGWGVDAAVCLNIATSPAHQTKVNDFAISINDRQQIFAFGSVHAENPDAVQEIYRLHEAGILGIKLHPDFQNFDVLDRRMVPIYDACAEVGMLCLFHSGRDPISPDHVHVQPDQVLRIRKLFPRLRMILAHMGGLSMWDEVEEKLLGTGIFMDTAYTKGQLPPEQFVRMIHKHGAENILFGSDCPWQSSRETADYIDSLPISSVEKDRIYYQNAKELLQM